MNRIEVEITTGLRQEFAPECLADLCEALIGVGLSPTPPGYLIIEAHAHIEGKAEGIRIESNEVTSFEKIVGVLKTASPGAQVGVHRWSMNSEVRGGWDIRGDTKQIRIQTSELDKMKEMMYAVRGWLNRMREQHRHEDTK